MKPTRLVPAIAALACFFIYAAIALLITSRSMPPTGDEPHYLITAHSLAVDGDISLKENYLNRDYCVFYPADLVKRTTYSPDKSRELPAFSPGLSMFLMPFYWLALKFFPGWLVPFLRLVICAVAALALYNTMRLILRFISSDAATEQGWAAPLMPFAALSAFVFGSPMITYSSMFYPEIVASLLLVLSLRKLDEIPDSPVGPAVWLSLLAPALIWLHPKYLALSFLLLAISLYCFRRSANPRAGIVVCLLQAAGIAAFFLFLHSIYGSWSPNRIYGGAQKDASLVDLLLREGAARLYVMARMLFGFWIDQRFGVLVYAPALTAFFAGVVYCIRRYGIRVMPALALFGAHFLLISWGAQMGGYAPPSRHFVVLIPVMLLMIVPLYAAWDKNRRLVFWLLAIAGWVTSLLILTHYRLIFTNATWRNPDGYSEFWSNWGLQNALPRLTSNPPDFLQAAVWTLLAAGTAFFFMQRSRTPEPNHEGGHGGPPYRSIVIFALVLLGTNAFAGGAPPGTILWAWERPEDLRFVDTATTGVAYLARTIVVDKDRVVSRPRLQPLRISPETYVIAVVRIETKQPEYSSSIRKTVTGLIGPLADKATISAIQIDFDATVSDRAFYSQLLEDLRARIPAKKALSITALASWCAGDPWLSTLPVSEAVPMLFRMGPDGPAIRQSLANGRDFTDELCRASIGISTDEPLASPFPGRRIYVFHPRSWTAEAVRNLKLINEG